ncbi:hypothetical protein [Carboxydothermus pertinax]|uniref:Uncharacterized protein n=1 Tax=Carboxydothermus pertinax TaxID=870242 RepID=A0A1L8CWX2_9THEO|nr:hypothetical protein [Carboxydothermus pertinax]GAV23426.1 hypothetical protein cpu_19360 [Carboxydothermus pertinax]
MLRRRFFILLLLISVIFMPTKILADQLYDKGRSYGTFLGGSNMGKEMNVVSASANKNLYNGWVLGVERVRAWARLENVEEIFPATLGYTCWINGAQIRLCSDDSRNSYLFIMGMNPSDSSSSTSVPLIIWDILDYLGVPNNIIQAYANNFTAKISSGGLGSNDAYKIFTATSTKINLPKTYTYNNADIYTNNKTGSSAEVYFSFDIRTTNNNSFKLWPQSKIQYAIAYVGSLPWFWWTNYAGVHHTIN